MSAPVPVRVTVLDTWDEVSMSLAPETSIGDLKQRALEASRVSRPAGDYLVKYLGAELQDEAATLAAAGVVPNGALIILSRRRIPAR